MFYDKFVSLCEGRRISPTKAAKEMGIDPGTVSRWKKDGFFPQRKTMQCVADYFGVSLSFLMEDEVKEEDAALSKKELRDIAKEVDRIMGDLGDSGDLMFDGVPMSDEARTAMSAAIQTALEVARTLNKKTYTPKKYRTREGQ